MSKKRHIVLVGKDALPFARLRAEVASHALPWELSWMSGSDEVVATIRERRPDAVLASFTSSELRSSLFQKVRAASPETVCVAVGEPGVVSTSGRWAVAGANVKQIEEYIERHRAVDAILRQPEVVQLAGRLDKLPSVPQTYLALTDAVARPDTTVADVAKIVQSDPTLTLEVLHLVNSAYFGLSRRVTSIAEAVSLLGLNQLKGLVLTIHVLTGAEGMPTRFFSLEEFRKNAVRVAKLARGFVPRGELMEAAFTAGVLLDIGKIVLGMREPKLFEAALERIQQTREPDYVVEREVLGTDHAAVGAFLLTAWQIPFSIVECVAFHHRPDLFPGTEPALLAAVHAADSLVGIEACAEPESCLDRGFLKRAGCEELLPFWQEKAAQACGEES